MKKIALVFFILSIFAAPHFSFAQTTEELQVQIQALQAQIQSLLLQISTVQGQLGGGTGGTQTGGTGIGTTGAVVFTYSMSLGSTDAKTGGQVSLLQGFLAKDVTVYPEGRVSGYFGSLTEKAVQRWQTKKGIVSSGSPGTTGYGAVGPKTRAALNAAYSGGGGTTTATGTLQITSVAPTSSVPGQTITLTGTGFSTTTNNIYFGATTYTGIKSANGKTLTLQVPSSAIPGSYYVSVYNERGYSNVMSVQVNAPVFILSASSSVTLLQPITGTNIGSTTIHVTPTNSSAYLVAFTASGLPTGATIGGMTSCVPTCSVQAIVTIRNTTPAGTYPISIIGTSGSNVSVATFNLIVPSSQAFTFNFATSSPITVAKPLSGSVTSSKNIALSVKSGVAQSVTFVQSGLPSGVTASTLTACKPPCGATTTLTITSAVATGTYPVLVTASGGGYTATTSYNLVITDPQAFSFSIANSSDVEIIRPISGNAVATTTVVATLLGGYGQSVTFSQIGAPSGVTVSSIASCVPTCTRTNTITVRNTAAAGEYPITIRGTSGGVVSETAYLVRVLEPDMVFDIGASGDVLVNAPESGSASASNIIFANLLSGYAQPVSFTQSGLPTGASVTGIPSCTPDCQFTNTVTVTATAASGIYPITITASGGVTTSTFEYNLIIQ